MNFFVRVDGWSNAREIQVTGNTVAMEIALSHSHCPTCSKRIRLVTDRLGTEGKWSYPGNGTFATFQLPENMKKDRASIVEFLGNKLGLSIYPRG